MRVESNAKKLLGLKYVWGATGPKKFDCSGFTQKVYRISGFTIPRNSRAQAKVGKYIKYEELQKGDMVFFDTNRKKTGRVNHVGIYLEDGKFIHASSGNKKVVITSFDKKRYYKSRFLWGRRVIKNSIKKLDLHLSRKNHSSNLKNI
jgi:cell wall-associated NlpC family hydrolase